MAATDNILIIKLGALGDFVQAFGPMRAIKAHHADARLTLLTTAPYELLARQSGLFADIWIDTRPTWYQPQRWLALKKKLNGAHFTRVYDLQNNDRTALYFNLLDPKPEWVGAAKGASHENASPARNAGHSYDGHKLTLALAGIHDVPVDDLHWMESDLSAFHLPARYALIVPGASAKRPLKRWPPHHYADLCCRLSENNITPVLIGSATEKEIAQIITATCDSAIDLTGRTQMSDLPALARGALFAVGNDTGPMHMIAPTGCASLVLFSADSNPVKHRPLGGRVVTVSEHTLDDLPAQRVWDILGQENFLNA